MTFDLEEGTSILARTPYVLDALLRDLPSPWIQGTEGPDTWTPFDVVGHLIHGERTDWIPRARHLLAHGEAVAFEPFDMAAQFRDSQGKTLAELLDTFRQLRAESLRELAAMRLTPADLERTGTHPDLGRVTLGNHLATWVAHDLDHIVQIARVMGKQYADAVGPWRQYMRIMRPV